VCLAEETIYEYNIHYAGLPVALVKISVDTTDSLQTITLESTSRGLVSAYFFYREYLCEFMQHCLSLPFYFRKTNLPDKM